MTTKFLAGDYPGGYSLSHSFTELAIEPTANVGGSGINIHFNAFVFNHGVVDATGQDGLYLYAGGTVTNGSTIDTTAILQGKYWGVLSQYGAPTITNFATIVGMQLNFGGSVVNGSPGDTTAKVASAPVGVGIRSYGAASSITNFGVIDGVHLRAGGAVTNGSVTDPHALIESYTTEALYSLGLATIDNFGRIEGSTDYGSGIAMDAGILTNGSAVDTSALISSAKTDAVGVGNSSLNQTVTSVINYGTINAGGTGVYSSSNDGVSITNGSSTDMKAVIGGNYGVFSRSGAPSIANFGTIEGTYDGVKLETGGTIDNGSTQTVESLITGRVGILCKYDAATIANFGTIDATKFAGVMLAAGGAVTNGSATDQTALITGDYGVYLEPANGATVTNFGVIDGTGGVSVQLGALSDWLVVEAGSKLVGVARGHGGVLDLADGAGTLAGLFSAAGASVAGGMSPATFLTFDTVQVSAGAEFTDADASTSLARGDRLVNYGSLTLTGAIANAGVIEAYGATLAIEGAVSGAGRVQVGAGTFDVASGALSQNVAFVAPGGVLELADSRAYAATISFFSKRGGTTLDLRDIGFAAGTTTATYAGTAAAGVLTVTDGSHTANVHFEGDYLGSAWILASDGHGGTDIVDPQKPTHAFVQTVAGVGTAGSPAALVAADHLPQDGRLSLMVPQGRIA